MKAATKEKPQDHQQEHVAATTAIAGPIGGGGALTPMEMLDRAISQGATVEVLEKLMALQERWEANQSRKDFDAAVAAAKAEIPPIVRNREGHNSKRYVDFGAIAKVVDPILAKHGLSYRFRTTQTDRVNVTCILFGHGHSEESSLSGPPDKTGNKNDIQAIGSTLTYLQRYSLVQALGLAAADDDDAKSAGVGTAITDEQADTIRALLNATKANLEKFLGILGAESVADIQASKFKQAVDILEDRKAKLAKATKQESAT